MDEDKTLKYLAEKRIFNIRFEDGNFIIYEMCDEYFATKLTTEMCQNLAKLFTEIGNEIK